MEVVDVVVVVVIALDLDLVVEGDFLVVCLVAANHHHQEAAVRHILHRTVDHIPNRLILLERIAVIITDHTVTLITDGIQILEGINIILDRVIITIPQGLRVIGDRADRHIIVTISSLKVSLEIFIQLAVV